MLLHYGRTTLNILEAKVADHPIGLKEQSCGQYDSMPGRLRKAQLSWAYKGAELNTKELRNAITPSAAVALSFQPRLQIQRLGVQIPDLHQYSNLFSTMMLIDNIGDMGIDGKLST